jgi:hypothetical protein
MFIEEQNVAASERVSCKIFYNLKSLFCFDFVTVESAMK